MTLSRAFTVRLNKSKDEASAIFSGLTRSSSQRKTSSGSINRHQISAPLALVSTSNMLVHNAPDIVGTKPIEVRRSVSSASVSSSHSSTASADSNSDASSFRRGSDDSLTDASSIDDSPIDEVPKPNHLSCYFESATNSSTRASSVHSNRSSIDNSNKPMVPQRMASHSKRAHESLHRKRTIQRMISSSSTSAVGRLRNRAASIETPVAVLSSLGDVDELAEEFGQISTYDAAVDAAVMNEQGLALFGADDYAALLEDNYV